MLRCFEPASQPWELLCKFPNFVAKVCGLVAIARFLVFGPNNDGHMAVFRGHLGPKEAMVTRWELLPREVHAKKSFGLIATVGRGSQGQTSPLVKFISLCERRWSPLTQLRDGRTAVGVVIRQGKLVVVGGFSLG